MIFVGISLVLQTYLLFRFVWRQSVEGEGFGRVQVWLNHHLDQCSVTSCVVINSHLFWWRGWRLDWFRSTSFTLVDKTNLMIEVEAAMTRVHSLLLPEGRSLSATRSRCCLPADLGVIIGIGLGGQIIQVQP